MGKQWKHWQTLFSWASKSLQMVTAPKKLKNVCFLEEKLWQPTQHIKKQRHYFTDKVCIVQLSHPYMTTGKTIALTRQTFVGKVMSLRFNMLSRLIIAFLPRSKRLLISWLQSPSTVILEPKKVKSVTVSIVSPSICHQVMGPDAMILVFWTLRFKPTFSLSSIGSLVFLCFLP